MNKHLQSLKVTAADIGHCLICGGINGDCICFEGSIETVSPRFFDDQRVSKNQKVNQWFCCPSCKSVVAAPQDQMMVRCSNCNYGLKLPKRTFVPRLLPEYEEFSTSALPKQALRKPSLRKAKA